MSDSAFEINIPSDPSKVDQSQISSNQDMSARRTNMVMSESAVGAQDAAIYAATRNKAYIGGALTYDVIPYANMANTNSSGVATFYLTDDNTSTGNALFSTIDTKTITAMPYGNSSNFQVTTITVSSDKKTVTVGVNQLGSVVLGLINVTSAAAGIPVNLTLMGK